MGTGQRPRHPFILRLCVACGVLLPLASVYPGLGSDLAMFTVMFSPLWFPVLAIGGLIRWIRSTQAARRAERRSAIDQGPGDLPAGPAWRRSPWTGTIVLAAWLLLMGARVPRRLAFLASRPGFDRHVAGAPISRSGGRPLDRRLGLYHIDEYAADPRGGVYFRSRWSWDGP